jgi:predicted helicase
VKTNRDAWVYNFSRIKLVGNMDRMIAFYNKQVKAYRKQKEWDEKITVEQFIDTDPKKISWTVNLKHGVEYKIEHRLNENKTWSAMYRPFAKHCLYYDRPFIECPGLWSQIFPELNMENVAICVTSIGSRKDFCTIITDILESIATN